jgi:hypothetical protein
MTRGRRSLRIAVLSAAAAVVLLAAPFSMGSPLPPQPGTRFATADLTSVCAAEESLFRSGEGRIVNLTEPASNPAPLDVPLANDGAGLYNSPGGAQVIDIEYSSPFSGLAINVSLGGIGGLVEWRYWNSTAFVPLPVGNSAETNFYKSGLMYLTWNPPSDWHSQANLCAASGYFVRIVTTEPYVTRPVAGQLSAVLLGASS